MFHDITNVSQGQHPLSGNSLHLGQHIRWERVAEDYPLTFIINQHISTWMLLKVTPGIIINEEKP